MKYLFIYLTFTCLFFTGYSQGELYLKLKIPPSTSYYIRPNQVEKKDFSGFWGGAEIGYCYAKNYSAFVGGTIGEYHLTRFFSRVGLTSNNTSQKNIFLGWKYYYLNTPISKFYLQLGEKISFLSANIQSVDNADWPYTIKYKTLQFNQECDIGYLLTIKKHFLIDFGVGSGFAFTKTDFDLRYDDIFNTGNTTELNQYFEGYRNLFSPNLIALPIWVQNDFVSKYRNIEMPLNIYLSLGYKINMGKMKKKA